MKESTKNTIYVVVIGIALIAAIGFAARAIQVNNTLDETSGELEEINEWLKENGIREDGDWIKVGNITVLKGGEYAIVIQSVNDTWLQVGIGISHEEVCIRTTTLINDIWTEQWNCFGEECLLPIT